MQSIYFCNDDQRVEIPCEMTFYMHIKEIFETPERYVFLHPVEPTEPDAMEVVRVL